MSSSGKYKIHRDEEDIESVASTGSSKEFQPDTSALIQSSGFCGIIVNVLVSALFLFLPLLLGFFTVDPQTHVLVIFWGKLVSVHTTPGLHWYWPFGRTLRTLPTSTQTLDIKKSTVVDRNGNPIVVAAIVTFKLVNTVKAALDVKNYEDFLERQAVTVLKRVCSLYPYEATDGKSLQSESEEVSMRMVRLLQEKANIAGAKIVSFELADLQYAPEIASGMLVRQQAQALIDARKTIVEGAVAIVSHAIEELGETGIKISEKEQGRLVSNLLAVICSDTHVQPVFSLSENVNEEKDNEEGEWKKQMVATLNRIAINTAPKG